MGHLLAMILTAYDPRVNPAAGLLKCQASQTCESLVKLLRTADALSAPAEDYTKIRENAHSQTTTGPTYRVLSASGQVLSIRAAVYA